jgi:hypothetical protein
MSALAALTSVKESSSRGISAATTTPAAHSHHTKTAPAYFYNAAFAASYDAAFAAKWNKYTGSGSWSVIG